MKIETAAELLYGWDKQKVAAVMKRRPNLIAQIEVPIHYAGVHWMVIDVYGEYEVGKKSLADMRCEINGESVDNILPESLLADIADRILGGDYD